MDSVALKLHVDIIPSCHSIFCFTGIPGILERRADLYAKAFNNKHKYLMKTPNIANSKSEEEELLTNSPYQMSTPAPEGFQVVCYYSLPSNATPVDDSVLMPDGLDASLCTHINLAFASISNYSLVPTNQYDTVVSMILY